MIINDNGIHREMTADEIANYEATIKAHEEAKAAAKAEADAKAAIRAAILAKLGLTADEAAALLG